MTQITLNIAGMHCASCAANITINLKKHSGISSVDINFTTEKGIIEYDEKLLTPEEIKKIIKDTGYTVVEKENIANTQKHSHGTREERSLKIKVIISSLLSLPLLLKMFWDWQIPGSFLGISLTDWVQHDLAFIVVFIFGWQFHKNAFKAIKRMQADMDTLISLGTLAAYFISTYSMFTGGHLYFEGAATITALILLGRYLEFKTKDRASLAMKKLMELGVKKAKLIDKNNQEIEKDIDDIRISDFLLVRPGEKIPLDGVIIDGQTNIDESMLTGESMPVFKKTNNQVFGASINQDGTIKIKVTKDGANTMLAQIIKTVEEAQSFKAPAQRLADRISAIFVPIVVVISIITFLGWFLLSKDLTASVLSAVAVLVISCPCALGIATPIAIMVGSSVGTRRGILIKNGESFERAKKIDTIIFDKTGTLTRGKPAVNNIISNEESKFDKAKILKIASSLAHNSAHPLSKAIYNKAREESIEQVKIENFEEIPGQGIGGGCEEHKTKILLGNRKLLKSNNIDLSWADKTLSNLKESGNTVLFVSHGGNVIAAISLSDTLKPSAKKAIEEIKAMNIEPMIISGDNKNVVAAVAKQLGVDKYLAEVLPRDKQQAVKDIQAKNKKVAFAGDGINDAPALVQADLGLAMASGTDIAKESGDIIIMQNEPEKISQAIRLSKKTFSTIKMNLFWAFFYNVLAIPLAAFGFVNPMIAALAMGFSDVTVIGNSLRIYRK